MLVSAIFALENSHTQAIANSNEKYLSQFLGGYDNFNPSQFSVPPPNFNPGGAGAGAYGGGNQGRSQGQGYGGNGGGPQGNGSYGGGQGMFYVYQSSFLT